MMDDQLVGGAAASVVAQAIVRLQVEADFEADMMFDSEAPGCTTEEGSCSEFEDEFLDSLTPPSNRQSDGGSPQFVSARESLSEDGTGTGQTGTTPGIEEAEDPATTRARVLKQVNFYFGDRSYPKDKFLRKHARADPVDGYVTLSLVSGYKKMKKITKDLKLMAEALEESEVVELSPDRTRLRRRHPPPKTQAGRLEATVVVENLAASADEALVRPLFAAVGKVIGTRRFRAGAEAPEGELPEQLLSELGDLPLHPALRPGALAAVHLVELDFPDEAARACRELNVPESRDAPRFTRLYRPGDISGYASPSSNPNSPSMRRRNRGRQGERGRSPGHRTPSVSPLRSMETSGRRHQSPGPRSRGDNSRSSSLEPPPRRGRGAQDSVSRGDGDRAWRDHSPSPLSPGPNSGNGRRGASSRSVSASPSVERRGMPKPSTSGAWRSGNSSPLAQRRQFRGAPLGSLGDKSTPPGSPLHLPGSPRLAPGSPLMSLGSPRMAPGSPRMPPGSPRMPPGSPRMDHSEDVIRMPAGPTSTAFGRGRGEGGMQR